MGTTSNGAGVAGQNPGATGSSNRTTTAAQQVSTEAAEFQLWASAQANCLSKLKIFHSMAKTINDQQ